MHELIAEHRYPAAMDAPRNARKLVSQALVEDDQTTVEWAVLVTSELTTNAIVHSAGPFSLRIFRSEQCIRIEVSDSSPIMPSVQPASLLRGGGRGLSIVEQLASAWGVIAETTHAGKTVWCEIATTSA
jgi:anti-sigma regulatory factor (Ser/Thr protein kinase)